MGLTTNSNKQNRFGLNAKAAPMLLLVLCLNQAQAKPAVYEKNSDETAVDKSSLKVKQPKPVIGPIDQLTTELQGVLNSMRRSGEARNNLRKLTTSYDKSDYFRRTSFGLTPTGREADPTKVKTQIQKDGSEIASKRVLDEIEFIKELEKGLKFDIDFANLFSSSPATARSSNTKKTVTMRNRGPVRYGLILKEIDLETNRQALSAAVDSRSIESHRLPDEKLKWTIGPIYEAPSNQRVFNSNIDLDAEDELVQASDTSRKSTGVGDDLWQRMKSFRPVFATRVKPANAENLSANLAATKKIGFNATLTQVQGLYQLELSNAGDSGAEKSMKHRVNLPIYGKLRLMRDYDYKMSTTSTRASGLLIIEDAPDLSVEYNNNYQQYIGESAIKINKLTNISMSARSDAKQNVAEKDQGKFQFSESYEIAFKTRF